MLIALTQITPNAERQIVYTARASSPNQDNPDYAKLIKYLIDHSHWSPFEHASATIEIVTSRAIAAQILRHRSFTFQEFSQRYAEVAECEVYKARRQDTKNRQNSIDDLDQETKDWWAVVQQEVWSEAYQLYQVALDKGIAKECARMILPLSTQTKLYMTGNIRSWIHYFQVRCHEDTQLEHREIALAIRNRLAQEMPVIAAALGWGNAE